MTQNPTNPSRENSNNAQKQRLPIRPRARHLSISASFPRRIIRLQHPRLTLIRLREGIATLLPHTLHLSDLADRLLELLHTRPIVLDVVLLDLLDVMIALWEVHSLRARLTY